MYLASAAPEIRFPNVYGIDMPTANELIAHGREVDEIRQIIGADGLIFRDLNDLIDAVRAENPDIQQFECSVFNGVYVTRDVDQQYLDYLDSCVTMMPKRSSCRTKSKTSRCTTRVKPFTRRGPAVPKGRRAFRPQLCVNSCARGYNPAKSAAHAQGVTERETTDYWHFRRQRRHLRRADAAGAKRCAGY